MINKTNYTISIYGIQDVNDSDTPTISHDHSITVMNSGKVEYSLQLERLNRIKHSNAMPDLIYKLLKEKKFLNKNCKLIFVDNILGRSFINKQGNIRFEGPLNKKLLPESEEGKLWWLDESKKARILNHELAHLGSCIPFFGGFKDNSLLVHFDGGASMSNFSVWLYRNKKLKNLEYNWKLKYLSSLFNANALVFAIVNAKSFEINSVPGKFMGFASFGKYDSKIEMWLKENNFFENIWGSKKSFFKSANETFGIDINYFDQKDSFIQNIAATIHAIFIRDSFNEFKRQQAKTKTDYLYYSGGSALNIVLNTKLIESNIFKEVYIPPCCNDSGLSLGAAAFCDWQNNSEIEASSLYLNNWNIENYEADYSFDTIEKIAELIIAEKVIGVCNGYGEIGPRALGNRSIICLASSKNLAKKVSMQHKKREWYRPVAPIMLEKNTKYFTGNEKINHLSKYMLLDFKIIENRQKELLGAMHIDKTARIQTIFERRENLFMFDLLDYLDKKHNVKALINTSFNVKGEPIVHTLEDAKKSAVNMKLDAVVLNGKLELFE